MHFSFAVSQPCIPLKFNDDDDDDADHHHTNITIMSQHDGIPQSLYQYIVAYENKNFPFDQVIIRLFVAV
jgi:hypothetical protein